MSPRSRTLAAVVTALAWSPLLACSPAATTPPRSAPGSTVGTPEAARDRVTTTLAAALPGIRQTTAVVEGLEVPALSVAALLPGIGEVAAADGRADIGMGTPVDTGSLFHVGSLTKTFTAALVLQLDQEGRLSIDDPISRYVSYPNGDAITVRQLLAHTSGIPDIAVIKNIESIVGTLTPAETVRRVSTDSDPLFAPGTGWTYSNTNYLVLGLIAEKVTGQPWHTEVRTRFFEPLGLTHTWVYGYEDVPATVTGYSLACAEAGCTRPDLKATAGANWRFAWAAGAVVSYPRDLAYWIEALVGGDVLDADHRALMQTATPQSEQYWSTQEQKGPLAYTGYGLGLHRYRIDGVGTGWGHSGSIAGFTSELVYAAEPRFAFALTANIESAFGLEKGNGTGVLMQDALAVARAS